MSINRFVRGFGAVTLIVAASCHSLDISNPNEPDKVRALSDPTAIEALDAGAMRTWFNAFTGLRSAGVLSTQARAFASSWNNGNLNFYSSIDNPTAAPDTWVRTSRSWQNDPSAAARTSIDAFWGGGLDESSSNRGGYYTSLSLANLALTAIRTQGVEINNTADTKRAETVAAFMQGASLMMLALNYDKAYIVDETSDLQSLQYSNRKEVRDAAITKLQAAATLAAANTFTTPAAWANGRQYTNTQLVKIINTMMAMTLAYYPRNSTEVAAVNWSQVATFASNGMSSGTTPVDFWFVQDGYSAWISELMNWFDGIDGGRVHTRVAHFMDPATQVDPWPTTGNPRPNSADHRLGDGSFGTTGMQSGFGTVAATAAAGSDFCWSSQAIMRPDRGSYHQSNICFKRYDFSGTQDPTGTYGGFGLAPALNATVNDLIWADALMRQGGATNIANAVTLINKTRVTRGQLTPATAATPLGSDADGPCMSNGHLASNNAACTLFSMLMYEKDVEFLGLGPTPFYEERRLPVIIGGGFAGDNSPRRVIAGLLPGTPREMPVPYKELGVKGEGLYTWGGATPNSPAP